MALDQLSPAGGATYNSQTLHVGDGTWDATKDNFLLPNIQGLNFDTMRYNGMGNRFATVSEYHTLIIGHGIMAAITFLVVVPAAILIASFYYRNPRLALRLHIYLQILTVILSTVVFVLGYFAVGPSRSLTNPHHGIGVAIYVLVLIQAIGGAMIHRIEKGKQRFYLPIKLMLHQWLGRAIALLAIAQIPIGLTLYGSPVYLFVLYALAVAALILLYFILSYRRNKRASYDYDEASSILTASQMHVNGGNSQQFPARSGRDDFLASAMGGAGLAALRRRFSGSRKLQKQNPQNVPPAGVAQSRISYDDQSYISEEKYRQNRTWRNRLFGTAAGVGVFEGFRRFVDPRHNHSEVSDYTTTSVYQNQNQAHGGRPGPAHQGQRPMTQSELAFAQAEEGRIPQQNDDWTRVEAMEAAQAAAAAGGGQRRMNNTTNTTYHEAAQANQQYGRQEAQDDGTQQASQQYERQETQYNTAQAQSESGHYEAAQGNQRYRRQEAQYPAGYNQSEASQQRSSGFFGKILAATGLGAMLERRRQSRHEHELDAGSGRQHHFDQRPQDNEHQPLVQPHQNHPGASIPNVQESPVRNNTHGERLYGPNSALGEQGRPPNFNSSTVTAQPPEPPVHQQDFAYPRTSPLPAVQTNPIAPDMNPRNSPLRDPSLGPPRDPSLGPPRDPSLGPPRDPPRNPRRNTSRVAFNLDTASSNTHSNIASTQVTASPSRHSNSSLSTAAHAAHPPVALHVRQSLDHVHIRRLSPQEAAVERQRAHARSRIDPIASPVLVANQNQSSPRPMGPAAVYHLPPPQRVPTASPVAVAGQPVAGPPVAAHTSPVYTSPVYASPAHTSPRPLEMYAQMSSPSQVAAETARHDAARQQRRKERMMTEAARQGVFMNRSGGTEFT